MLKLLYMLAGGSLAQTISLINLAVNERIDFLKKRRELTATYVPNPALFRGTPEAEAAIARSRHQQSVQPDLKKISRSILLWRLVPIGAFTALTIGLFCWIVYLESAAENPAAQDSTIRMGRSGSPSK